MLIYFQWEFGSATDNEYKPLSWPLVQSRIQARIDGIMEATGADEYQLYITSDDKSNFRYNIATIRPYKGNRKKEKPYHYARIRKFLLEHRDAILVYGHEADDELSIQQCKALKETVIASRDKDLNMVPGYHYCWGCGKQKEKKVWFQDEIGGLKCYYKQLLIGDSIDNIPGLYGVGKSSKLLDRINKLDCGYDMFLVVLEEYEKRFGSYAEQFLIENGRLLWMLQKEGEVWEAPKKDHKS